MRWLLAVLTLLLVGCPDPPAALDFVPMDAGISPPETVQERAEAAGGTDATDTSQPADAATPPDIAVALETTEPDVGGPTHPLGIIDVTPGVPGSALRGVELQSDIHGLDLSGVQVLPDGDVIPVGIAFGPQIWVGRVSPQGEVRDSKTLGEGGAYPHDLTTLTDGRLLAVGHEDGHGFLIELSTEGTGLQVLSERRFLEAESSVLRHVSPTDDGGAIAVGRYVEHPEPGKQKRSWWLIKLGSDLEVEWQQLFEGTAASHVRPDNLGGYVSVGFRTFDSTSGDAAWLIRTDPDGVMVANREFLDTPLPDRAIAVSPLGADFLAIGSTTTLPDENRQAFAMRVSSEGTPQSSPVLLGGADRDALDTLIAVDDGWLAFGHRDHDPANPYGRGWIVHLDSELNPTEYAMLSGEGSRLMSVARAGSDGSLVIAGSIGTAGGGQRGLLVFTGPEARLLESSR
ncbi:MAG: hypothetical protein ACI9WU_001626 [Myxococcota bacterium]|jgi:hypothetical protein